MNRKREPELLKKLQVEWEANVAKRGVKERKDAFFTRSDIPVKTVYTPVDLDDAGFDYMKDLNFPGDYPYTRGIEPGMYRESLWLVGQYGGFGSSEETNQRFKYLLSQGMNSFTIALDLPTQMGYDSDHVMAKGEVGKTGVAVNSLQDIETIFRDIPLSALKQVGTLGNAISPHCPCLVRGPGRKAESPSPHICRLSANEILKEYVARGAYFLPCLPE